MFMLYFLHTDEYGIEPCVFDRPSDAEARAQELLRHLAYHGLSFAVLQCPATLVNEGSNVIKVVHSS